MSCPVCGSSNATMTRWGDYKCLSCGWKEGQMSPETYKREMLCPRGGSHNLEMASMNPSESRVRCTKCGLVRHQ